jgi:hypothetical protein
VKSDVRINTCKQKSLPTLTCKRGRHMTCHCQEHDFVAVNILQADLQPQSITVHTMPPFRTSNPAITLGIAVTPRLSTIHRQAALAERSQGPLHSRTSFSRSPIHFTANTCHYPLCIQPLRCCPHTAIPSRCAWLDLLEYPRLVCLSRK